MPALVNKDYFFGVINLDTSRLETQENIAFYSDFCEEKYLKMLLGNNVYYDYVANKTASKYTALISAGTFTHGGVTYKKDVKQMLAYFMFQMLSQDNASFSTVMGDMSANNENATPVIATSKIVRAYNLGVEYYKAMQMYLSENESTYTGYETTDIEEINIFGI